MSATKNANGYSVSQDKDGQWWIINYHGEQVAGPLPSKAMAVEVAAVFQDERAAPATKERETAPARSPRRKK
ncbi:hypothetical protein FHJ31_21235 [Pseudomonas sp. Fig-3]|jgi:hypothetical protein|uniref:Uncharacterized protein n=1 Tax=Pseudomonas rhizophila TaxID=2045200 RepID=A0ABN5JZ86_9PSED|nr:MULTISPECIES: hypothetical protein [Pseudomonas]AVU77415.1 hypothetical protein CRX69_20370 [Pseudomonas rhizophila]MBD0706497.1 hypothetical protein [Pseudomonas sp. PSB1]MDD2034471.1 hypothetical protein [Pseudomonas sp. 39167]MDR8386696.1 hypothetical protein [Pseudomonas sp. JL2]MEA1029681.1 hypothetical protein [Pseudomonas sp. N-137]